MAAPAEFALRWAREPGDSLDSAAGVSIARREARGRLPAAYINIYRTAGADPKAIRFAPGTKLLDADAGAPLGAVDNPAGFPPLRVEPRYDLVNRLLIAGPSGAGKSTIAGHWLSDQQRDGPVERDIFLLSRVTADGALDDLPLLQRLPLDEEFAASAPLTAEDFKDSIVLFDDTDTISDKKVRQAVTDLRDDLLETGRHQNVQSVVITHQLFQGAASKKPLGEATGVVVFPQSGSKYHIRRYLKEYCGYEPEMVKRVMSLPSRWAYIQKTHPAYVIHEKGAFLV
jgi:hypothetical protein